MPGVHCRLESISQEGTWLQSDTFVVAGVEVHREAGQSVGNTMQGWRNLRDSEPGLFEGVRVWQSPTAFADSIIYAWQQADEASRFGNIIRVVDSLRTHWTEQAAERNFLCQAVQACVPPGCTPLCQVTDTGLAQPAKAAASEEHDRQRRMLRLKAREEGAKPSYKVGPREILQTVQAMHKKMCAMNASRQTVLAEARACGWLRWRPDTGRDLATSRRPALGSEVP